MDTIRKHAKCQSKEFVDNVRQDILTFTEGFAQNDDITFVAVKENANAAEMIFKFRKGLIDDVAGGMSVKKASKKAGVSTSTYYRYKKKYAEFGDEGLKVSQDATQIETKHMSVEQRAKLFDVICESPELGPKEDRRRPEFGEIFIYQAARENDLQ